MDNSEDSRILPRGSDGAGELSGQAGPRPQRFRPKTVNSQTEPPRTLDAQSVLKQVMSGQQAHSVTTQGLSEALETVPESDKVVVMLQMIEQLGGQGAALTTAAADAQVKLVSVIVDKLGPLRRQGVLDDQQIQIVSDSMVILDATASSRQEVAELEAKWSKTKTKARVEIDTQRSKADHRVVIRDIEAQGAIAEAEHTATLAKVGAITQAQPERTKEAIIRETTKARKALRKAKRESAIEQIGFVLKTYVLPVVVLVVLVAGVVSVLVR